MSSPATANPDPSIDEGPDFAQKAWAVLRQETSFGIQALPDFLQSAAQSTLSDDSKAIIVSEASVLIDQFYPHLPFKQHFDLAPLATLSQPVTGLSELAWHNRVLEAVSCLVDSHTVYGLPSPYAGAIAFLPFMVDFYRDRDHCPHFLVTNLLKTSVDGPQPEVWGFERGVEILAWDMHDRDLDINPANANLPTNQYAFFSSIASARGALPSGNSASRVRRGVLLATLRPLRYCEAPASGTRSRIAFAPLAGGPTREISIPWGVATGVNELASFEGTAFSLSRITQTAQGVTDLLHRSAIPDTFRFQTSDGLAADGLPDPALLRSASNPAARFGYLQIRKFSPSGNLVQEFRRILHDVMTPHAPNGLLIDIRGNPGGDIQAAEQMLQMLTNATITPINFHLANTAPVKGFLRALAVIDSSDSIARTLRNDLKPWIDALDSFDANSSLSPGQPITDPGTGFAGANAIGQVYRGPCALLTDALSYSAADMFAAGFQDHAIGPVIGADQNTGGGGANVWTHDQLVRFQSHIPALAVRSPLPPEVELSIAFRRAIRSVGPHAGEAIEDNGVAADVTFIAGSRGEVLNGSPTIVQFACSHLTSPRAASLRIRQAVLDAGQVLIEFDSLGLDFLQIEVDGHPSLHVATQNTARARLSVPVQPANPTPKAVQLFGCYLYPDNSSENYVRAVTAKAGIIRAAPAVS